MSSKSSKAPSKSHISSTSRRSRRSHEAVVEAAIKGAELQCQLRALKQRRKLDEERDKLELQVRSIERDKEELSIETALSIEEARMEVLREEGGSQIVSIRVPPPAPIKDRVENWLLNDPVGLQGASRNIAHNEAARLFSPTPHHDVGHGPDHEVPSVSLLDSYHPEPVDTQTPDGIIYNQPNNQSIAHQPSENIIGLVSQQSTMTKLLLEHQLKSTLPQLSIKPYKGDPLEYNAFTKAFQYGVENKTQNAADRLYYLEQYTVGDPNRLVRSCLNKDPELGYTEARDLLLKKFGNKFKVAEAFKQKVENWPLVKNEDAAALENLSLFLIECCNTMTDLKVMSEMDHATSVRKLLSKIPYHMQRLWRNLVDSIQEGQNRVASFADFVHFIEKQSRIASNPVYGKIGQPNISKVGFRTDKKRVGSFALNAVSNTATKVAESDSGGSNYCLFCDTKTHTIEICRTLQRKPHADRIAYLKGRGMCFGCLKKGTHLWKDCKKKLQCNTCKGRHPTVLHQERRNNQDRNGDTNSYKENSQKVAGQEAANNVTCRLTGAGEITTQTVLPVLIQSTETGEIIQVNAMLDDGSNATFCTEKLRQKLGHKGGMNTKLHINTITGDEIVNTCKLKGLQVMDVNRQCTIELPEVYTRTSIPANADNYPTMEDLKMWSHLREVNLPDIEGDVDLLIGNNIPKALEPWQIIHSTDNDGPFASKTLLGWTVHGLTKTAVSDSSVVVNRIMVEDIDQKLTQLYNADFVERIIEDTPQRSVEDGVFMKKVSKSVRLEEGHYEIGLPLRNDEELFPNNIVLAEQRLAHLKRKFLRSSDDYRIEYTSFVEEMVNKGYAEKVPEPELEHNHGRVWYIPHHSVYHPQKGKIRVVFDCAATYHGVSLNDKLLQGPDLTNSLVGVILRFRQEPTAMMADIKSMFHQVRVPTRDRDLLRFLWWPNGDTSKPIQVYRMKSHIFGAKSSPSCANFALRQTALDNQEVFGSDVASTLLQNFYVDDCLRSVASEDQAIHLASGLQAACRNGGFRLTKWVSNSRMVIQSIPEEDRASGVKALDFQDVLPMERALGVLWCPETDSFRFHVQVKDKPATRRGILSIVSSIYDPLGFLSPAILPAKRILQDLCKVQLSWDEEIPEMYRLQWDQWLKKIPAISSLTIPRYYVPSNFGTFIDVQLHHFSDASELGYGVVSYLRFTNQHDDIYCMLVSSRSRVAPLKQVTIPRLELTAATVATKLNYQLHKELNFQIDNTWFWTDSTTTLQYIQSETKRFKTFVANRLAIIRDGSEPSQWRYVNTSMNPADECSRGLTVDKFLQNDRWLPGPPFLWNQESMWPETMPVKAPSEDDPECKHAPVAVHTLHVNEHQDVIDRLIEYHSSWYSLKRAVAWILKVKQKLLSKIDKKKPDSQTNKQTNINKDGKEEQPETNQLQDKDSNILSHKDLQDAEKAIIRYIQHTSFAKEIAALEGKQGIESSTTRGKQLPKSSPIYRLDPQLIDGVLHVGGRLNKAAMPEESKHPYILPKDSVVLTLFCKESIKTRVMLGGTICWHNSVRNFGQQVLIQCADL